MGCCEGQRSIVRAMYVVWPKDRKSEVLLWILGLNEAIEWFVKTNSVHW